MPSEYNSCSHSRCDVKYNLPKGGTKIKVVLYMRRVTRFMERTASRMAHSFPSPYFGSTRVEFNSSPMTAEINYIVHIVC